METSLDKHCFHCFFFVFNEIHTKRDKKRGVECIESLINKITFSNTCSKQVNKQVIHLSTEMTHGGSQHTEFGPFCRVFFVLSCSMKHGRVDKDGGV